MIYEQRFKVEAPHAEAAIEHAENGSSSEKDWTPRTEVHVTKILKDRK